MASQSTPLRNCANCGRTLGALETGVPHGDHVVCVQCKAVLNAEQQSVSVPAAPATERLASGVLKTAQQATDFTHKYIGTGRQLKTLVYVLVLGPVAVAVLAALFYACGHHSG